MFSNNGIIQTFGKCVMPDENNQECITMKKTILLITFLIGSFPLLLFGQHSGVHELIQEGVALHDSGEYRKAIEKYNEAIKLEPKNVQATYELSLSYLALRDFKNAEKFSTVVIKSNNEQLSPGAYAVKSEALVEMDKVDEAIELLQEGLKKNGDEYLLHFNMAINYYKKRALDNALDHLKRAINLDKTDSGAFLLNAYALNDKGLWVQSILSFQMFLLLEPDSKRSRNAFEEMLHTMRIKKRTTPVERSFIQQQMMRNQPDNTLQPEEIPPLNIKDGLNRNFVYHAITTTLDSLQNSTGEEDEFTLFKTVNREIIKVLEQESKGSKEGILWTFYIPFFSHINESTFYDTFCRYISVSYFPESLEWWQQNSDAAANFINWVEKGDNI